ncbi:MAG TPA: hypothetical protein VGI85_06435 [Chthoniobacterales bacterium]
MPLALGGVTTAHVPFNMEEQSYIAASKDKVPAYALATLAVPENFDPNKTWPILIVLSTSDARTQNREDVAIIYASPALAEGWIVISGDGPAYPHNDSAAWRGAMTLAAVDALSHSFPGSNRWPVACPGYSGGSKRTGFLAPLFSIAGCPIIGIDLTSINVDTLSDGYRQYRPGSAFLHTPIFVSTGEKDKVATLKQQWESRHGSNTAALIACGWNVSRKAMS